MAIGRVEQRSWRVSFEDVARLVAVLRLHRRSRRAASAARRSPRPSTAPTAYHVAPAVAREPHLERLRVRDGRGDGDAVVVVDLAAPPASVSAPDGGVASTFTVVRAGSCRPCCCRSSRGTAPGCGVGVLRRTARRRRSSGSPWCSASHVSSRRRPSRSTSRRRSCSSGTRPSPAADRSWRRACRMLTTGVRDATRPVGARSVQLSVGVALRDRAGEQPASWSRRWRRPSSRARSSPARAARGTRSPK